MVGIDREATISILGDFGVNPRDLWGPHRIPIDVSLSHREAQREVKSPSIGGRGASFSTILLPPPRFLLVIRVLRVFIEDLLMITNRTIRSIDSLSLRALY